MLECSLGKIDGVVRHKALSAYTFVEFTVPVETYSDAPVFSMTIDNVTDDYEVLASEVYMRPGDKTVVKITAIRSGQRSWFDTYPVSVDSAEAATILNSLGISNGPQVPVTLLNLFLTRGQLAIVLANMSPKTAFVDFSENKVLYYSDMYKQKPTQVQVAFRRIYSHAPIAGYVGWEQLVTGVFPKDTQVVLPFGQFGNVDQVTMENLMNNCNDISKLFSDMQIVTLPYELPLGSTVLSALTHDKKVIVAIEEQWDAQDNVLAACYCV